MSLHLIELPISIRAISLWAGARRSAGGPDEGLILHHVLVEAFGPGVLQPFRLMVAPRAQHGTLYAYADCNAEALRREAEACLTPALAAVVDLDRLRSLPRPASTWTRGQRIGFDLRIRPVVRLASDLDGRTAAGAPVRLRKGAEVDAFVAVALRRAVLCETGTSAPDRLPGDPSAAAALREPIYLDWLAERLGVAAVLDRDATKLASFQRTRVERHGRRIDGPDAVVHGTFVIADPASFAALLARGVGRHRSYGYGMLLLRPPQRLRGG